MIFAGIDQIRVALYSIQILYHNEASNARESGRTRPAYIPMPKGRGFTPFLVNSISPESIRSSGEKRNTTEGSLTSVVLRKEVMLRILRFVYLGADDGSRNRSLCLEGTRTSRYTTSA